MNSKINQVRGEYLDGIRRLTIACFQRATMERVELCCEGNPEPEKDALERYARLRVRISTISNEIQGIEEKAEKKIGVLALLGEEPEIPIHVACSLLLARTISDIGRPRTVGELADYSVGTQSPSDFLAIRQSFSRSGILRPYCSVVIRETTLDEMYISLTERSVCKMLALPESDALEFEIAAERGRR